MDVQCKIIMVSLSDRKSLTELTWPTIKSYCEKNNYKYEFCDHLLCNDRAATWSKILLLKDTLIKYYDYDYVVWMDDDILITSPVIKLEDIIKKFNFDKIDEYVMISEDFSGCVLNAGAMVLKVNQKSINFLNSIWSSSPIEKYFGLLLYEQDVIKDFYLKNNKDILIIPFCNLQSFYKDAPDNFKWRPGHFSAHFSGCVTELKIIDKIKEFYENNQFSSCS